MADIARLAGVHVSTVSRALAGSPLIERRMREKILKIAAKQGYVVNATARNLRTRRTQTLNVAIPLAHESGQALTDPFFTDMLGHLADEITQRGYAMHLQKILPPMQGWLPKLIRARSADGIIVIGQSTEHAALEEAARDYAPLVVWGGQLEQQRYCVVGTDNAGGARLAAEHLLAAGRRRIVFVGDPSIPEIRLRRDGCERALKKARAAGADVRVLAAHMTADAAYESVRGFIARGERFDAVFAATDVIAISAMRAIAAAGLAIPRDVAVVGFDDIPLAAHVHPPLTTVRQDIARGAKLLVDLVLRRLAGENAPSVTMPAELVVRESSASG
ncbi:MAG: substrate-binding domain-containing protein [Gammaproteobacteria bacterium]|nr:substrate-binding domain-containing protein [Gammaproteobacteria bacterium]